ncbi:MAG: hypothetical protein Q9191_003284 [Dirinaria sp. TL-2023a]
MHEILTIQLGHRANHIATHFWNAQESYFTYSTDSPSPVDHDIHFRAGLTSTGEETYTPRALVYDLKGGFGSLRRSGGLYEDQDASSPSNDGDVWYVISFDPPTSKTPTRPWQKRTRQPVLQQSSPVPQHPYQQSLNTGLSPPKLTPDTVRYWSDYARVFYHPRSIVQINDYELASSIQPFERWESGEELYETLDKEEGILDRDVRRWVEECDLLQGVQVVMSADDAWGGFGSRMVEGLRDEMDKGAIWAWAIEEEAGTGSRVSTSSSTPRLGTVLVDAHEAG